MVRIARFVATLLVARLARLILDRLPLPAKDDKARPWVKVLIEIGLFALVNGMAKGLKQSKRN